jgi:hypothetical protein
MSKRIEEFMQDHRAEFDSEEPSPMIWQKLEKQLLPAAGKAKVIAMKSSISMIVLRWSAAAALLILAALGVYHLVVPQKNNMVDGPQVAQHNPPAATPKEAELLKDINPTYAKEVYHFTQLIELKQSELKQIGKDNPELYKRFTADINKLDSSYNGLKKELPNNPNREQLLEAMIQNLRLQTELLNQQLQIIQQIKQSKKGSNEGNSKSV